MSEGVGPIRMDHQGQAAATSKVSNGGEDEWDAEGFEIPSLNTGKQGSNGKNKLQAGKPSQAASQKVESKPENLYFGPHGAPPKTQDASGPFNRKQRLKQKLKDAEKKGTVLGRENKVETLRDLMGGDTASSQTDSSGGWLEPYCNENQFERSR